MVLALGPLGCMIESSPPESPSSNPDAGDVSSCSYQFDKNWIMDTFAIRGPDEGFDLNNDSKADNGLGFLGVAANDGWVESIAKGETFYIWDIGGWGGRTSPERTRVRVAFFSGSDADDPPDPTNNVTGGGNFFVPAEQFDVNCEPTSAFPNATILGRTVYGEMPYWSFVRPGVGTVEFVDARLELRVDDDLRTLHLEAGAVWTMCGLSRAIFPGGGSGTFLDQLANSWDRSPDIDRDGDGLEQVLGNGTHVIACVDGDGTHIDGSECACDPRIKDGYSVAFAGTGVPAHVLGIR